jgi:hypothetical protein
MDLNAAHLDGDASPLSEFCALAYWTATGIEASPEPAPAIVLVLREKQGRLRFLVHPGWRTIVCGEDLVLIESLLRDFAERAKLHPDELFKHLSSLGVGPLVTQEAGSDISEHPSIEEMSLRFKELE